MESTTRSNAFKQSTKQNINSAFNRGKRLVNDDKLKAVEKYVLEWKSLSQLSEDVHLRDLRKLAVNGGLKTSKFRSICWSLLLEVLTGRSQSWLTQKRCDRNRYAELFKQFYINPRTTAEDDPLSQSDSSVWNQHFCDKELCTVIRQDVVRTIPGVEFFRRSNIQDIMTNILFCYARINPLMCYRQGMHEILAPIIFVMHCDHQAFLHIKEMSTGDLDAGLKELLDPKYIESDSFFIFAKVMKEIESFYRIHDLHPTATGYFPATPTVSSPGESRNVSDLEVVAQLNMIRDKILAKADSQLHNHLVQLDIPFPLFGIRWLRLLFGREFQLFDLLILWDAIFAEASEFELTNYIVVAMLISIREEMLHSDYTTGLSCLMKYPSNIDVMYIIRHSLHLHAPDKYERPIEAQSAKSLQPSHINPNRIISRSISVPHSNQSLNRGTATKPMQPSNVSHNPKHHRNSQNRMSSSPSKSDEMRKRVNSLQKSTAKATIRSANKPQLDQDPGIVDGYLENSTELLRMQLQNSQTVMTIARHKLRQYLGIFRRHIPGDSLHELHQAMDGIEELCELLNVKEDIVSTIPTPVEPAFEANELALNANANNIPSQSKSPDKPQSQSMTAEARNNIVTSADTTTGSTSAPECIQAPKGTIPIQVNISKPARKIDQDARIRREFVRKLKIECDNYGVGVGANGVDPRATTPNEKYDAANGARYEVPDMSLSQTAVRILADRKELEMHEFSLKTAIPQSAKNPGRTVSIPIIDPSGDRSSSSDP